MRGSPQFGRLVRERRAALDMTQEELARRVGCAASTVKKIEAGALRPSRQVAGLLADRLGVAAGQREAWVRAARLGAPADTGAPVPELVGRERDLEALCAAVLAPGARLTTLVGPPGVGKTRLALAAAARLAGAFEGGARAAPLAGARGAGGLREAAGLALGLRDAAAAPWPSAAAALVGGRRTLLVLDGAEHLAGDAAALAELLEAAPALAVLVTSRSALELGAERVVRAPPLALPPEGERDAAAIAASPAVELFVRRARAARPGFALTEESAGAVAAVCRRLDGLPLAIELAAARAAVHGAVELLAELDRPLALLGRGARDAPERHRTLRGAIGWSEGLLGDGERRLLRALAVFEGGFGLGAAAALLEGEAARAEVADRLQTLAGASLVEADEGPGGEMRFRLLATVRAYALERLAEAGEGEEMRRRHAARALAAAEAAAPGLRGRGQLAALARLDEEQAEVRAALAWALAGEGERRLVGARLALALWYAWFLRGRLGEARRWLAEAAAPSPHVPEALRAEALVCDGFARYYAGGYAPVGGGPHGGLALARRLRLADVAALGLATFGRGPGDAEPGGDAWLRALALAERTMDVAPAQERAAAAARAVALAERTGDRWLAGRARWAMGMAALDCGRGAEAERHLAASERLHGEVGHLLGAAYALLGLACAAWARGDSERAAELQRRRLEVERRLGNPAGVAHALGSLGSIALAGGALGEAERLLRESLGTYEALGEEQGAVRAEVALAWVDLRRGDLAAADGRLAECAARAAACGFDLGIALAAEARCDVALAQGECRRAALLLEESGAIARRRGHPLGLATNLRQRGELARLEGRRQEAAGLLAESAALFRSAGSPADGERAELLLSAGG